jgi:hypothetical protein
MISKIGVFDLTLFCKAYISVQTKHNKQIKKESVCYTPACEWPAAIVSQACAPQTAPIITGVMFLFDYRAN